MKPIMFPATLVSSRRHADKTISVTHRSNFEMSTEDFAEIDKRQGDNGYSIWSSNEIQADQIPDVPADEAFGKMSPSQETRWLLKKLYEQGPQDVEWVDYYRSHVGQINKKLRDLLV